MAIFSLADQLLSLIYPRFCLICGLKLERHYKLSVCRNCRRNLRVTKKPYCFKCGAVLETISQIRKTGCNKCYRKKFFFDQVISAFQYKGIVKQCIHLFKYNRKIRLRDLFSEPMRDFLLDNFSANRFDIVTAVPLHKSKLRKRGFNQSQLIAENISTNLQIDSSFDNLVRTKKTVPQFKLKAGTRKKNLENVFFCKKPDIFKDKNILLIDDILTTGSTLNECSRTLKQAGAKSITCLTIAR